MYRPIFNRSEAVDIAAADHVFTMTVSGIYCGGAGNLVARLRGDTADVTFAVPAGHVVMGDFIAVRQASTASPMVGLAYQGSQR